MADELQEKDFIRDERALNPWPMWIWLVLIAVLAALLWGGGSWIIKNKNKLYGNNPFLQVSNRQFSLFLWQNPEYMRTNVSSKAAYLPGFQYLEKINIEPGQAEAFVEAPLEVMFAYHVWHRLLSDEIPLREISKEQFLQFLNYSDEWKPQNWPLAPSAYKSFVEDLPKSSLKNLEKLPLTTLPLEVRQAFEGWKNYFIEGEKINEVKPNFGEMENFLSLYPHYARNYWRNLYLENKPNYLKTFTSNQFKPDEEIPEDELSALLKVNFYNYKAKSSNDKASE